MAPPLEPLTYEDVTKVYREEKKSAGLTVIRHDFYSAVRALLDQLKRDYEKESLTDSYSTKTRQLSQSIPKIREKVLQIFDMRADKIMHMAVLGAAGGKVDHSRLTDEEKRVLDSILVQVREMRGAMLDLPKPANLEFARMSNMPMPPASEEHKAMMEELVPVKEPEMKSPPQELTTEEPTKPPATTPFEAPMETGPIEVATPLEQAQRPLKDAILLRILEDIPPFAGPSGTYVLGKEDVVTLPSGIGKALVKRGKAIEIVPG